MKLNYQEMGEGSPLIILHGLFGMSDNWLSVARRIARKHHVFIPDQRNHGRSPQSDRFTYEDLVADLHEFITDHNLSDIKLIGHSMGGKVAMRYALIYAECVQKLVAVDIAPKNYYHPYFRTFVDSMMAIDLNRLHSRQEADRILSSSISHPAVRQFLLKNLYRDEKRHFRWRIHLPAISANLDRMFLGLEEKGQFEKPALFVHGGRSEYVLPVDYPLIKRIFPAAQIERIPEASHWLHADAPDELCKHLRAFL